MVASRVVDLVVPCFQVEGMGSVKVGVQSVASVGIVPSAGEVVA